MGDKLKSVSMAHKKERKIGSVNLNSNELPEIEDWAISEEYEITLKVKMTSISEVDSWDIEQYTNVKKGDTQARFEIKSVVSPKKEQAKKTEKDLKNGIVKTPINISLK